MMIRHHLCAGELISADGSNHAGPVCPQSRVQRADATVVDNATALGEQPLVRSRRHEADLLFGKGCELATVRKARRQAPGCSHSCHTIKLSPTAQDHAAAASLHERSKGQFQHFRRRQAGGQHGAPAHCHRWRTLVQEFLQLAQRTTRREVLQRRCVVEHPCAGPQHSRPCHRFAINNLAYGVEGWPWRLLVYQEVECRFL
mmetsp:Transcript_18537/g.43545  ORF Transcript_18537/g.43545 Transcript_18537/m.43545 type:complete len:201 (+) Transcript_18537:394-996(+)